MPAVGWADGVAVGVTVGGVPVTVGVAEAPATIRLASDVVGVGVGVVEPSGVGDGPGVPEAPGVADALGEPVVSAVRVEIGDGVPENRASWTPPSAERLETAASPMALNCSDDFWLSAVAETSCAEIGTPHAAIKR